MTDHTTRIRFDTDTRLNNRERIAKPTTNPGRIISPAKTLKIPFEKFYLTLQKYGNISSASCAISLDEAVRDGSIQPDNLISMPVFGGGLTWGGALIRW